MPSLVHDFISFAKIIINVKYFSLSSHYLLFYIFSIFFSVVVDLVVVILVVFVVVVVV
jgi:hypothetical protein